MDSGRVVRSVVSPKVIIQKSQIHGLGMFAKELIKKGEIVFIKGGHILTRSELYYSEKISSYLPIDDEYYIGATTEDEEAAVKLYNNHSCEPNCGVRGEITFVAMRDIPAEEELTCDYAMIDNEAYEFECSCETKSCRGKITGFDWMTKELQLRYAGYFARYLNEKIDSNNGFS